MESKVLSKNIFYSILLQITIMISGLIVPRIILTFFGSTTNGLISSINQFLTYGSLMEGGVGMVITASLYEPLRQNNLEKISSIVNASRKFCNQMGGIYALYSLVVVFIFTFFVKTNSPRWYVALLVIVLSLSSIIEYMLSMPYRLLLNADRKVFYVSITQIIIVLSNLFLVILIANLTDNVLLVKLGSALVYLIQPLMYTPYVRKHYKLNLKAKPDKEAIKHRWDGFGQQIAYFVSANTDMIVITFFLNLKEVSVYSIYNLVANALSYLLVAVSNAIVPSVGNIIASHDTTKIRVAFNNYELSMVLLTFTFYTCAIILLLPFIMLYTKGVNDANYYRPGFGLLMLLGRIVYCCSEPYLNTCYAAGHIRQLSGYSVAEALINITLSLLLVKPLGLIGIMIGTLISSIYRLLVHVNYLNKKVVVRSNKRFAKLLFVFIFFNAILIFFIRNLIPSRFNSYIVFFTYGLVIFLIATVINLLLAYIFFRKEFDNIFSAIRHRI